MKIKHASSSLVEGFRGLFVLWAVIIGVLVLDQLTKNLVLSSMNPNESIPILQGVFHLTYVQNTGIAFGLFQNANLLFGVLSALIIAGIVLYLPHIKKKGRQTVREKSGFVKVDVRVFSDHFVIEINPS